MLFDPDDAAAAKDAAEPLFALTSGFVVADVAGTKAKLLEENSDSEPSKSISALLEVTGAAEKKNMI